MNAFVGFLKRLIACLMIVATLSFSTAGSYLQIQEFQVYAMADASIFALYRALVEAVLASLGISLSSKEDLNTISNGLYADVNANQDFVYGEKSIFSDLKAKLSAADSWAAVPIHLEQAIWNYLQLYLQGIVSQNFSKGVSAPAPLPLDLDLGGATFEYVSDFSFLTTDTVFQAKPFYYDDADGKRWNVNLDFERYDPMMVVYSLCCSNTEYGNYSFNCQFLPFSEIMDAGTDYQRERTYVLIPGSYTYRGTTYDHVLYPYYEDSTAPGFLYRFLAYNFDALYYGANDYWQKQNTEFMFDAGNCYIDVMGRGGNIVSSSVTSNYILYDRPDLDNVSYYVYLRDDVVLWPSVKAYQISKQAAANYAPSAPVYGSKTAASKPLEVDENGNVSVQLKQESITEKVEQAVADAIAANNAITQEQINSVVTDIVAVENGVKDAIDDNTGAIEDSTKTLASLLSSVLTEIRSIAVNVSAIKTYTDGSSALAPEKDDIRDLFHVVEYVPPDPDDGGDDDGDGKVDVWLPPPIISVASFLKPLLEYFGQPLSRITQFQNAILEVLQNLDTWITSIPENLLALFSSYALPLDSIINGIQNLPGNLADAIADSLHIELPAISFPEIPNYTGLLSRIIELLESFFLINTPVIMASLAGFNDLWEEKLPFWARISGLYNGIDVPDYDPNGRIYPVISMKTPDILQPFYDADEIVLVDFADYAEYMIWVRSLIRGILWFSFGLSIFNHLKTNLHIG